MTFLLAGHLSSWAHPRECGLPRDPASVCAYSTPTLKKSKWLPEGIDIFSSHSFVHGKFTVGRYYFSSEFYCCRDKCAYKDRAKPPLSPRCMQIKCEARRATSTRTCVRPLLPVSQGHAFLFVYILYIRPSIFFFFYATGRIDAAAVVELYNYNGNYSMLQVGADT